MSQETDALKRGGVSDEIEMSIDRCEMSTLLTRG